MIDALAVVIEGRECHRVSKYTSTPVYFSSMPLENLEALAQIEEYSKDQLS